MTTITHMPIKTKLELALARFELHLKDAGKTPNADQKRFLDDERAHIQNLAQITQRLKDYYGWVEKASYDDLVNERHDSKRLGENMRAEGRPKPTDRHDAHAIVSGCHPLAVNSRIKLAEERIGIDEGCNGAWLPRSGNDARVSNNWATPKAVPHSRIHRGECYRFVDVRLNAPGAMPVRDRLRIFGSLLEQGALPKHILEEMQYDDLQNS